MIQRLQQKRNEEGFTLIELLIVIIVLGILAAIVVFAVGTTRDDAAANACKTDVKSVQLSAEAVKTKSGNYPATSAGLTDPAQGGLLKSMPTGFTYARTGTGTAADPYGYTITPPAGIAGCSAVSG